MKVLYSRSRDEKLASDIKQARRVLGDQHAKGLTRRIKQLESADTLGDVFPPAPGMWHWLKADRAGFAAGTIKGGLRLIIRAENGELEPPMDATTVTVVEISEHYENRR